VAFILSIIDRMVKISQKKVVNKRFAIGKGEYEKVISDIEKKGKCPFCPDNFKYHKNPILKKVGDWFVTKNSWPYKNTKYHFLIINKNHKELFSELTKKDFESIRLLTDWLIKKYKIKGGAFALRFGDTDYTGATVCHIHAHILCPKIGKNKKSKTVYFPVG
jgi:diadenosine tetraphosphate (Ap4A) HIT family hydrolase